MLSSKNSFISLVRLGIGHPADFFPKDVDWNNLKALAMRQGLSAVLLDGLEKIPENRRPTKDLMLQWIGEVMQSYEARYRQYAKAIGELAELYQKHEIKMMVLKGYACSQDWPKPEHRPCGDIDIWQFGKQNEADALLRSENGIRIDNSHEHHTVFSWYGFMVENHYDFIDVHHRASSPQLEKIFKELGKDDSHFVEINNASTGSVTKVYIPSPNLHALFLLRHMMEHFAATEITLRHILDWGFHVQAHTKEIDWTWLMNVLDKYGMRPAFNIFNAICVDDLGFDAEIFPEVTFILDLKERVLLDIITPEFSNKEPKGLVSRVLFKYRRWKTNEWKHKMCYNESMWSAFCSSLWGHILKPSQI